VREWSRGGLEKVGNTNEPAWDSENENGLIRIMGRENSLVFGVTDHFYERDAFTVSLTALWVDPHHGTGKLAGLWCDRPLL